MSLLIQSNFPRKPHNDYLFSSSQTDVFGTRLSNVKTDLRLDIGLYTGTEAMVMKDRELIAVTTVLLFWLSVMYLLIWMIGRSAG